jgi:hypothetical protein
MTRPRRPVKKIDDRHLRLEYKGGRCVICGRTVKAMERRFSTSKGIFEFNHIDPSQKARDYSKLIRRVLSATQLDELDKCNLLCRVCHGVWTNQRLTGSLSFTQTLPDGRTVTKDFLNHGLIESHQGRPKIFLFADNPADVDVYEYKLGEGKGVVRVGYELESDLAELLLATRREGTLRIRDRKGSVFKADRVNECKLRFEFCVRFAIIKLEGKPDVPGAPHLWVRNGKVIIDGQRVSDKGVISAEMEYSAIERGLAEKAARESA